MGILKVENNLFGEIWLAVKVISLAGITCDHETELLILTRYMKKVFENIKYIILLKAKYKYCDDLKKYKYICTVYLAPCLVNWQLI